MSKKTTDKKLSKKEIIDKESSKKNTDKNSTGKKNLDNKTGEPKEEKIITKYDKKVARRREEARRDKRNAIIAKTVGILCLVAIVVALVVTAVLKVNRIFREYIKIDGKSISQIEFDFYYGITKNSELSTTLYGTMTYLDYYESYLGYDSETSDSKQDYSTDTTWYDHFASSATDSILEYKALLKVADEAGYEYTTWDEDYEDFESGIEENAASADMTVKEYYKELFGKYATKSRVKQYIKDYYKATAYYEVLQDELAASDSDISEYYEENKDDYDLFSYRLFSIGSADTDEGTMEAAQELAEEFAAQVSTEEDFIEMCKLYEPEEETTYSDDEDASLASEYSAYYFEDNAYGEWLLSEDRVEGDVEVIADSDSECVYIVYYISRQKDDEADDDIASVLLSQNYSEYIAAYTDDMAVDVKKHFTY